MTNDGTVRPDEETVTEASPVGQPPVDDKPTPALEGASVGFRRRARDRVSSAPAWVRWLAAALLALLLVFGIGAAGFAIGHGAHEGGQGGHGHGGGDRGGDRGDEHSNGDQRDGGEDQGSDNGSTSQSPSPSEQ